MNLIDVSKQFVAEAKCADFLEAVRWPKGVTCLICGSDRISKFTTKGGDRTRTDKKTGETKTVSYPGRFLYQCLACKYQFSATVGTVFADTHLPLQKWFMAIAILVDAKKSVSSRQLARHIGVATRTAWYLNHRIRKAMVEGVDGLFKGTVEVDETYIGGKYDKRRKRAKYDKEPVFGILARDGKVKTWHVPQVNRFHIMSKLKDTVSIDADLVCTDESQMYKRMPDGMKHEIVNHSAKEWVRGAVHTGGIDGYRGLLKRAIIGSFHQISIKHLHRYLSEAEYKWNHRDESMFEMVVLRLVIENALRYKALTANSAPAPVGAGPEVSLDEEPF